MPPRARALLSCLAYGTVSIAMTLTNKSVAVIFRSPLGLIFAQNAIQTAVLCAAIAVGVFTIKADLQQAARAMAPLNVLFVGMLYTSMQALQRLPVPVITVIKNCGNGLIVLGDWYLYDTRVSYGVMVALVIVVTTAGLTYRAAAVQVQAQAQAHVQAHAAHEIDAQASDPSSSSDFSVGIFWMCANLFCTASYSLYAAAPPKREAASPPGGMSFVNGVLSLPIIIIFRFWLEAITVTAMAVVESPVLSRSSHMR